MMQEYHKGLLQLGVYNSGHNNNVCMTYSLLLGYIRYMSGTSIERPILGY